MKDLQYVVHKTVISFDYEIIPCSRFMVHLNLSYVGKYKQNFFLIDFPVTNYRKTKTYLNNIS